MTASRTSANDTDSGVEQSPGKIAAVPVPVEEIGTVTHYHGTEKCEYGCGSPAEYHVEISITTADIVMFGCGDCLRRANVPVEDAREMGR